MKNLQALLIWLVVLYSFTGCSENKSSTEPVDHEKSIFILYTNDEHGWMEKSDYSDGSAAMMGLWREQEGYTEGGPYLILSGGDNWNGAEDTEVAQVVSNWQSERDAALSDVIGYAGNEISRYSSGMHNMVTDAWLYAYPTADISMTNSGGIRQSIPSGEITLATMVGVLPFENSIVELELTGVQVIDCLEYLVVGGMTTVGGYFHSDGTPLVADSIYHVLTIDYLYARTDYNFSLYDPTPYNTAIHYRQPVIDWIESLNTSSSDPLNNYLDYTSRR